MILMNPFYFSHTYSTSMPKVFLRTDRVMQNDFDSLSAIITLLTSSGILCIRGELLFENPVHRV